MKKGDEVEVRENGNSICIYSNQGLNVDEITINVGGLTPRLVDRFIARAYQKGYDKVIVMFKTTEQLNAVREKIKELLGFEIMDTAKDSCIIQTISSKLDIDFDSALRKAFIFVLDMADSCLEAYEENDRKGLLELYNKDYEVNKFCYYCLRYLNKEKSGGFGTSILYYLIETLEDVGDSYKYLAKHLSNSTPKKEIAKILKGTNGLFRLGYEFFYNPNSKKATESLHTYNDTLQNIENTYKKLKETDDIRILAQIEYILKLVYHYPTMRLDTLKEI